MIEPYTCCFIGHQHLPPKDLQKIVIHLDREIERCIANEVTTFLCKSTLGFNQIAASLVISKKELGRNLRLIFVLPHKNHDSLWSEREKSLHKALLKEADHVIDASEEVSPINHYIIDHSTHCICAPLGKNYDTREAIAYARQQGLIINIIK